MYYYCVRAFVLFLAYCVQSGRGALVKRIRGNPIRHPTQKLVNSRAALGWLAEDSRKRLQLPAELKLEGLEDILREHHRPELYETTLFRIAQECLTNAARHAHAQKVVISLRYDQQDMHLQVCDDGRGYDPSHQRVGIGISGMRERVALLGGKISIRSEPGQGTKVEVSLPVSLACTKDAAYAW